MSAKKREFTPVADTKKTIIAYANDHPALVYVLSAVSVVAMGILLFWFVNFSGYTAPATFVYAGF